MNMIRKVSVAALSLVLLAGCGSASTKETHDNHKLTVGMECNYLQQLQMNTHNRFQQ